MYTTTVRVPKLTSERIAEIKAFAGDSIGNLISLPVLDDESSATRYAIETTDAELARLTQFETVRGVSSTSFDESTGEWVIELRIFD